MAEFQAYDPRVLVNGQTVLSVVAGMGAFKETAVRLLKRHAITNAQSYVAHRSRALSTGSRAVRYHCYRAQPAMDGSGVGLFPCPPAVLFRHAAAVGGLRRVGALRSGEANGVRRPSAGIS